MFHKKLYLKQKINYLIKTTHLQLNKKRTSI